MNARLRPLVALVVLALAAGWVVLDVVRLAPSSRITIAGTSNVHDWTCTVAPTGSLNVAAGVASISDVTVTVPVSAIDCRNGTMNGNLRRALNAQANPQIRYVLTSARPSRPNASGAFTVATEGRLTVAGQTRPVTMQVQGRSAPGGQYRFTGSLPITMSQYGVRPPTAMMGTMRTGDRVTVSFDVTTSR